MDQTLQSLSFAQLTPLPSKKTETSLPKQPYDKDVPILQDYSQRCSNNEGMPTTGVQLGFLEDSSSQNFQRQNWRPDVFAQNFVSQAYVKISTASAVQIMSEGKRCIDYANYVSKFASPLFLPPRDGLQPSPASGLPILPLDQLKPEIYERHFVDNVTLDIEAHKRTTQTYDLFGVPLRINDLQKGIFNLHIAGLRENTPQLAYGDSALLRQLILDPRTKMPTGFTGYELWAHVTAVDKRSELLYLRIDGIIPTIVPLVCNVRFVINDRRVQQLRFMISDIAQELQSHGNPQNKWLRRMLFPELDDGKERKNLPSVTFGQEWRQRHLNYEQKKAVSAIQSKLHGNICYLINGPPGTGKTTTVVETVIQLATDPDFLGTILLCAPSDAAADSLASSLKPHFTPQAMVRLNEFPRTFAEVPGELLAYCYVENDIFNLPSFQALMSYRIVVTTCAGAEMLVQARMTNRDLVSLQQNTMSALQSMPHSDQRIKLHWTALIVDEAAQATEPELLVPLAVVAPKTRSDYFPEPLFAMAGDHFQLGPRVHDRGTTLGISLLERLLRRTVYGSHVLAKHNVSLVSSTQDRVLVPPFTDLVRNYRSHPAILAVPSSLFYKDSLIHDATETDALLPWDGWRGRRWPVLFCCNGGVDDCEDLQAVGGGGWYNQSEAEMAIQKAQGLIDSRLIAAMNIAIMSPFRSQVGLLRQTARSKNLHGLNIGPMDAYQGLEHQAVIICTTRAQSRFLAGDALRGAGVIHEPNKFNVALTRAMQGLIVLGNPWVLSQDPCWLAFLKFCWRNGLWEPDTKPRDPRMPEGNEGDVGSWAPSGSPESDIGGLEAALIYKEREQQDTDVGKGVRRFMGRSQEDEMWLEGVEAESAMEALSFRE